MIDDGWTAPDSHAIAGFIGSQSKLVFPETARDHIASMYQLDTARAERLRAHIANVVNDETTASKLQPWYAGWCKRPAFHDDYLPTFNRPNVTLIDTQGKGIVHFTASGVVANGTMYDLDVLILATGFTTRVKDASPSGQSSAPIIGRNGSRLCKNGDLKGTEPSSVLSLTGFPTHSSSDLPEQAFRTI